MSDYNILVNMALKDRVSKGLKSVKGTIGKLIQRLKGVKGESIDKLGKSAEKAESKIKEAEQSVKTFSDSLGGLRGAVAGVTGAMGAMAAGDVLKGAISSSAQLEKQLDIISSVVKVTDKQFSDLTALVKHYGSTTQFSSFEAAQALEELVRAGLNVDEAMSALGVTLDFAIGANMELGESADLVTNIMTQFGIKAKDATLVTDALQQTANTSSSTVEQLGVAMSYVGGIANSFGYDINETAGFLGKLHDNGIKAERAGTGLRNVLSQLNDTGSASSQELSKLGITSRDLATVIEQLNQKGESAEAAIASFGIVAGPSIRAFLTTGANSIRDYQKEIAKSKNVSRDAAVVVGDNLVGSLKSLESSWDALRQSVADPLLKGLASEADELAESLNDVKDSVAFQNTIEQIGETVISVAKGVNSLVKVFSEYQTEIGAVTNVLIGLVGVKLTTMVLGTVASMGRISGAAVTAATSMKGLRAAMLSISAPVTAVLTAVVVGKEAFDYFIEKQENVNKLILRTKELQYQATKQNIEQVHDLADTIEIAIKANTSLLDNVTDGLNGIGREANYTNARFREVIESGNKLKEALNLGSINDDLIKASNTAKNLFFHFSNFSDKSISFNERMQLVLNDFVKLFYNTSVSSKQLKAEITALTNQLELLSNIGAITSEELAKLFNKAFSELKPEKIAHFSEVISQMFTDVEINAYGMGEAVSAGHLALSGLGDEAKDTIKRLTPLPISLDSVKKSAKNVVNEFYKFSSAGDGISSSVTNIIRNYTNLLDNTNVSLVKLKTETVGLFTGLEELRRKGVIVGDDVSDAMNKVLSSLSTEKIVQFKAAAIETLSNIRTPLVGLLDVFNVDIPESINGFERATELLAKMNLTLDEIRIGSINAAHNISNIEAEIAATHEKGVSTIILSDEQLEASTYRQLELYRERLTASIEYYTALSDSSDVAKSKVSEYQEALKRTVPIFDELTQESILSGELIPESIKAITREFDSARSGGTEVVKAIKEIAESLKSDLSDTNITHITRTLKYLGDTGRVTAEEIDKAMSEVLSKLSDIQLKEFVDASKKTANDVKNLFTQASNNINVAMSESFNRIGIDYKELVTDISAGMREAVNAVGTLATTTNITGEEMQAAFLKVITGSTKLKDSIDNVDKGLIKTDAEAKLLKASADEVFRKGIIDAGQYNQIVSLISKSLSKTTEKTDELSKAFDELGITSQAALDKAAASATKAFDTIAYSGTATTAKIKEAFIAYATTVLKANGGIVTSTLEVQAEIYGMTKWIDDAAKEFSILGKVADSSLNAASTAANTLTNSLRNTATQAQQTAAAISNVSSAGTGGSDWYVDEDGVKRLVDTPETAPTSTQYVIPHPPEGYMENPVSLASAIGMGPNYSWNQYVPIPPNSSAHLGTSRTTNTGKGDSIEVENAVDKTKAMVDESEVVVNRSKDLTDESEVVVDKSKEDVNESKIIVDKTRTTIDKSKSAINESESSINKVRNIVDESENIADKSRNIVNESQIILDKSKVVTDESKVITDRSNNITDESRSVVDKSITISNESKAIADNSEVIVDESRAMTNKSENISNESKVIADKSEVIVDESRVITDNSEAFANESKTIIDKSEVMADESKAIVNKSEVMTDESKTTVDKSEIITNESRTTVDKSKAIVDESQSIVDRSKAYVDESENVLNKSRIIANESLVINNKQEKQRYIIHTNEVNNTGDKANKNKPMSIVNFNFGEKRIKALVDENDIDELANLLKRQGELIQ